ncbi:hypothetical protein F2Q70_00033178 [Brassica cretica]|uniref:BnaC07g50340D protein n=5 Tax=Brassica TaxID=3705 RepID=A0A078J2G0_BRANA|nr:PREDICTED: uncharacterized protein LOC106305377 [Brassica oleracea var. oleracea]XP_013705746.1 uncharacterized protein BNAC07G50340D [Brassica napus]KAF2530874.1 hypothetical protein F2Q70_00033178 [Brassica cretica]VDD40474.1 unnamed protein product [Brassica oleracea]KAF2554046.1 hypothetical protein F2Q68_00037490 [Brassica cretica]KAF3486577.1 hypothetical protein F2Q69_00057480 [Brassica cretica]KAH0871276.1 hypothetical protein HID58_078298 [Brassica napus]
MGGCASVPKESDIVEGSAPTENVVVESKDVTTETDTTLTQEKKEESGEEAKKEGETKEDSSEATKAEPTPEAVKADEKAPSESETPTQETAPAKTDEAPLVIL